MNTQCPSLEQINTNSGKVNISPRYLFELRLCPRFLYIEFSDQYVEERFNRFLPGIQSDGVRYLANGPMHSSGEVSLIPATTTAFTVTHHRHSLLLRLILVHYLPRPWQSLQAALTVPFPLHFWQSTRTCSRTDFTSSQYDG